MYHLCWQKKKPKQLFPPLVPECSILVSHNKIYQSSISVSRTMRTRGPTNCAGDVQQLHLGRGHSKDDAPPRGNQNVFPVVKKVVQNEARFKWKRRIISMHHNQPQGGTLRLPSRRKHFLSHWNKCSLCCCSLKSPPCHLFVFGCNSSLPTSPSIVSALVCCALPLPWLSLTWQQYVCVCVCLRAWRAFSLVRLLVPVFTPVRDLSAPCDSSVWIPVPRNELISKNNVQVPTEHNQSGLFLCVLFCLGWIQLSKASVLPAVSVCHSLQRCGVCQSASLHLLSFISWICSGTAQAQMHNVSKNLFFPPHCRN